MRNSVETGFLKRTKISYFYGTDMSKSTFESLYSKIGQAEERMSEF